jgi:uncharacterized membrane protein YeaQ/YmgE (transglycosylase-associated protein family)
MGSLIVTLVVGGVVGWLASVVMKTNGQMGIIANIVVGIVGSFLGSWIFGILGIAALGGLGYWVMAVVGAMVLIAILRAVGIFK